MSIRTADLFPAGRGFTLIEVLTTLSIVAILASILIPTTSAIRVAALRTRTRGQFAQWSIAMEQFRAEYGYYPLVATDDRVDVPLFLGALTGRDHLGQPLAGTALNGNLRRASFYTPGNAEILRAADGTPLAELVDAFGNSHIAVLVDRDGDGVIRGSELVKKTLAGGNTRDGLVPGFAPIEVDLAPTGSIHAGVAFYSAGRGVSGLDYVLSWK